MRRLHLCDDRAEAESVASWVVVAQPPPAGCSAAIESSVVVYLRRPAAGAGDRHGVVARAGPA
jgi:hypothetical protein